MNPPVAFIILAALFAATVTDAMIVVYPFASRGNGHMSFVGQNLPSPRWMKICTRMEPMTRTTLRSTPGSDESTDNTITPNDDADEDSSELSVLDKVNNFLDTPILDANNRSDQGALAEALKAFVRDEPEIAQVTFSAVVIGILVVLTRIAMSF